jgi:hypothetical protein
MKVLDTNFILLLELPELCVVHLLNPVGKEITAVEVWNMVPRPW